MSGAGGPEWDAAGRAAAARLYVPAVTAIVADPTDPEGLDLALAALLPALRRAGVLARRVFALVAHRGGAGPGAAALRALGAGHRIPVVVHDPVRSATAGFGRTPGGADVELNDELREAEAVVLVGPLRRCGARIEGGADLIHPGLARAGDTRLAPDEAARIVGVDAVLLWREDGAGRRRPRGGGPEVEAELRRAIAGP
jgi:nickel-dependent lactate racemase